MAGDIQGPPTHFTSVSVSSTVPSSASAFGVSVLQVRGGSQITMHSNTSLIVGSGATVTYLPGAMWSVGTIGTAASLSSLAGTGMQIGFFFAASGCSIIGRSGNTIYTFGASAVSAAAP